MIDISNRSAEDLASEIDQMDERAALECLNHLVHVTCEGISTCTRETHGTVDRLSSALMLVTRPQFFLERASVLIDSCLYFIRIGRAQDGISRAEAARAISQQLPDRDLERRACSAVGPAYALSGQFALACDRLEQALSIAQEMAGDFQQAAVLSNVMFLLKEMGLYQDAARIGRKALALAPDDPRGKHVRFLVATSALFSASRMRDESASLFFLDEGSRCLYSDLVDPVSRATFEYYRALHLINNRDSETAESLIQAAKKQLGSFENPRVEVLLGLSEALCDWASGEPRRIATSKVALRAIYERAKAENLYVDDVLRGLVQVYGNSIDAAEAERAIGYANELVEYITNVKGAAFFRQLRESGAEVQSRQQLEHDPLEWARGWLGSGAPAKEPPLEVPFSDRNLRKHDELAAVHEDMAALRLESLARSIRSSVYDVAESWALVAEFLDDQTGEHCFRVGRLASLLAKELGLNPEYCARIDCAARLHDIGKIGINALVLLKPGPLDVAELASMRHHTTIGGRLLAGAKDPTLQMAAQIARGHHCWWNGSGYPGMTSGTDIPLAARISALADVYDALTHERPYKKAWSHASALEYIEGRSGTQFQPEMVPAFLRVLQRWHASGGDANVKSHDILGNASGLLASRRKLMNAVRVRH